MTQKASYTFTLFAPNNADVALAGSFSDWQDRPMQRGDDGIWRLEVPLSDGTWEYVFKVRTKSWFFELDSWITIVDPRATEVNQNGDHGVLHLLHGQKIVDTFEWQHDDVPLPNNEDLVIYELHVGDFTGADKEGPQRGRFRDLHSRLEYLVDLGIKAVQLMPVSDTPGQYSWGYNPRHFFAIDYDYGTSCDLKAWIDACHGRGMRVILDVVLNHAEGSSPLTHIDHDYWFRREPKDKEFNWGPEFNYEFWDSHLDVWPARQFAVDVVEFWVREYHLDGIRYDGVKQIDNFDALRAFNEASHRAAGPRLFYNIGECVPENPALTNLDGPLDACWHDNFCHTLLDLLTEQSYDVDQLKRVLDGRQSGYGAAVNMVNYGTNHDHNHVLADLGHHGFMGDPAYRKVKQGAVLCVTAVGVPMLWMGEEVGEFHDETKHAAKVQWRLLEAADNQALLAFYRSLVRLRHTHASVRGNDIDFFFEHVEHRVLAYRRGSVVVLVHVGGGDVEVEVPVWPGNGTWQAVLFEGASLQGGAVKTTLSAYETRVFVSPTMD